VTDTKIFYLDAERQRLHDEMIAMLFAADSVAAAL
jgi:hypothetical protein